MAMTVNPIEHLTRVTAWANRPDDPLMGSPFSIEAYGHRWAVGSSPHFAVAVRREEPLRLLADEDAERVRRALFLELPASGRAPASRLAPLREWCGKVAWPVAEPCPECKSVEEARPTCDFCDGFGTMIPVHEPSPGWIGEVLIDRAFLAWALEPFDDERVAVASRGPREPIHVIGKSWIVTVMPRVDRLMQQNAPHLFVLGELAEGGAKP